MHHRNSLYRFGAACGFVVLLGTGSTALTFFARHMARQDHLTVADDAPDAHATIRSELVRIWLPPALLELAKRQAEQPVVQTQERLGRIFDVQHRRDVWYALTMRAHQDDGKSYDITAIRWPCEDRSYFPEFLHILAVAAGKPPGDSVVDYSSTSVYVIPEQLLEREPREVVGELLKTGGN